MIAFHYRQLTKDQGLWVSIPQAAPEGVRGEQHMRQGVIGGHLIGEPRCAVAADGFFFGLDAKGKEITRAEAVKLGLVD